jgi:hypothetical protein
MAKLERIDGTEAAPDVLLERDDTDVALDILNELGQAPEDTNWKFTVCRINTDKNGVAINGALEPQILEGDASIMEDLPGRLREQFGTGRYRVRVLMNKRLWKRFDIAVERSMQSTPVATIQPQSEMATVLSAIGKTNEKIFELLSRPQTAIAPVSSSDPVAMFKAMVELFKSMQPATPPAPVDSITAPEKAVELIMKGVTLAQSLEGGGREKGMMDLLSDALNSPIVAKLLEGVTPATPSGIRLPPSPRRAVPPAPGKEQVKDTPPAPEPTQDQIAAEQMKRTQAIILWLLDKANHGSSFETYAEWAFDNLPPPLIQGLLAESDPVASMLTFVPQIASQKQWFTSLIDELRQLVNSVPDAAHIDSADVPGRFASPIDANANPGRDSGGENDFGQNEGIG